jgi:hypothetical protein
MATDKNYILPTSVAMLMLAAHATKQIHICVLGKDLSEDELKCLNELKIPSKLTVDSFNVPQKYFDSTKDISTLWNSLVGVRLEYPNIARDIEVGEIVCVNWKNKPINTLLHLDSDIFCFDDITNILKFSKKTTVISSVNLHLISYDDLKFSKNRSQLTCISGGVVVWNLHQYKKDKYRQDHIITTAKCSLEEIKLLMSSKARNLVEILTTDKVAHQFFVKFLQDIDKYSIVWHGSTPADNKNKEMLFRLQQSALIPPTTNLKVIVNLMNEFMKKYPSYISTESESTSSVSITELLKYFCEESTEHEGELKIMHKLSNGFDVQPASLVTEEDVLAKAVSCSCKIPARYNFQVKYIIPSIDQTPPFDNKHIAYRTSGQANNFEDLQMQVLTKNKNKLTNLLAEVDQLVILHFDMCQKPWVAEFNKKPSATGICSALQDLYDAMKSLLLTKNFSEDTLGKVRTLSNATKNLIVQEYMARLSNIRSKWHFSAALENCIIL